MTRRRLPRVGDVVVILSEPDWVAPQGLVAHLGEVTYQLRPLGSPHDLFCVDHQGPPTGIGNGAWWYRSDQLEGIGDVR
jgi:hypothetical protein